MQPVHRDSQSQQVGNPGLLSNAVAVAKFLAHIPERAAGFVGKQANAVYSSLPLAQEKTEKGINTQEKKVSTEPPKTSRSFTGSLASVATKAETKVRRAFTQIAQLPDNIVSTVIQKKLSVEDFQKKLEEVQTTQAKWCKAYLTSNKEEVASTKQAARQQLRYAKLGCKDPKLVAQMQKTLELSQGIVNDTAMLMLKQKDNKNFQQLQAMGLKLKDSDQWKKDHAELAEIADASSKEKLNNLVAILDLVKGAYASIEEGDYVEARVVLDLAEKNLNDIKCNGYLPFDNIITNDSTSLSFAILQAQSRLPKEA